MEHVKIVENIFPKAKSGNMLTETIFPSHTTVRTFAKNVIKNGTQMVLRNKGRCGKIF